MLKSYLEKKKTTPRLKLGWLKDYLFPVGMYFLGENNVNFWE